MHRNVIYHGRYHRGCDTNSFQWYVYFSEGGCVEFLEDSSMYTMDDLNTLAANEQEMVIGTVAEMLLSAYIQVSFLQAERSTYNSPELHVVPPVLLSQIYTLSSLLFFNSITSQSERMRETRGSAFFVTLED